MSHLADIYTYITAIKHSDKLNASLPSVGIEPKNQLVFNVIILTLSTNVPFMEKPVSSFLLANCVKNMWKSEI